MKDYSVLEGLDRNFIIELRCAYDRGYRHGRDDEWAETKVKESETKDEGYNRGVNDLWESICKYMDADIVLSTEIWGCTSWEKFAQLSPFEVIERLKKYEKKHYDLPESMRGEIKVGDIVETRGFSKPVIVINTPFDFEDSDEIKVMNYLGDTAWVKIENCSMTGRHIDKLAETFEQLKNE